MAESAVGDAGWSAARLFTGTGAAVQAMREHDWAAGPLGPVEDWPAELRAAIRTVLPSEIPMLIWWGPDLIQIFNDAYRRLLGAKYPEAVGQPAAECWSEVWPTLGPLAEQVITRGEAIFGERERLFLRRHGYLEETYWTFSYSPISGGDDSVAGVFVATNDVTPQVLAGRRFDTLRDLGRLSVIAGGMEETCRAAVRRLGGNPADLPLALAYLAPSSDDHQLKLVATAGVEAGREPTAELPEVARVARSGRAEEITGIAARFSDRFGHGGPLGPAPIDEVVVLPLRISGRERPVGALALGLSPYRSLDESYRAFLGLIADRVSTALTEAFMYAAEHRRAAALAELDEAKNRFFANVSHELRTPLTLIAGPIEETLADPDEPVATVHRERLETVRRNTGRLHRLVDDLLEIARFESGRLTPDRQPTDLAALTRGIAQSFEQVMRRAGLRYEVVAPTLARPTLVDREMWEKILVNLLSNAFKYTLEGEVQVRLRDSADGESAVLSVTDTGVGISPEQRPRLFERFHRVDGESARSHEGAGIGLALVWELVRLHEGRVEVESEPGVGSTFTVRLPHGEGAGFAGLATAQVGSTVRRYVEEAVQWLPEDTTGAAAPAGEPPGEETVLVVEDNADLRRFLTTLLGRHWRVEVAADGRAALAQATASPPDLVLADVMMPKMDGFELLTALRTDPRTALVPVIMLSGRAGQAAELAGFEARADDYLVKPFATAELVARVRANLMLAKLRNQEATWQSAVTRLSNRLAEARDSREVLVAGMAELRELFGAEHAAVIEESRGSAPTVVLGTASPAEARHIVDRVDDHQGHVEVTADGRITGVGGALDAGDPRTVLWLRFDPPRVVSDTDRLRFRLLCDTVAHALRRAQTYDAQRTVALTLQRSILGPAQLPPGFAVRYEPAVQPLEVGGDWYDVVVLPDDKVAVVVGDCVGSGLAAAAVMGQLRSACRALLLQAKGPGEVLDALDVFAGLIPDARCTTLFCAVIDQQTGEVCYSSAGHPPALLFHPDDEAEQLDRAGSFPLATIPVDHRPETGARLRPGSILLLYTDGLIERRGEALGDGIARTARAVTSGAGFQPAELADHVVRHTRPAAGYDDDTALLVYCHPQLVPFTVSFPARPAELRPLRTRLAAWLAEAEVAPADAHRVQAAIGEACTNAIEHAYRFDPHRQVEVQMAVRCGELQVMVRDSGRWIAPNPDPEGRRGRGRAIMGALMDGVVIEGGPEGTTVRLTKELDSVA